MSIEDADVGVCGDILKPNASAKDNCSALLRHQPSVSALVELLT